MNLDNPDNGNPRERRDARVTQMEKESLLSRRKIYRNWKRLKQVLCPEPFLEELQGLRFRTPLSVKDLRETDMSLALDKVLIAGIRCIESQTDFEMFRIAVEATNRVARINWDAEDYPKFGETETTDTIKFKRLILGYCLGDLTKLLKYDDILEIKDTFIECSIFTIDDFEVVVNGLIRNRNSPLTFINKVIERIDKGSFDCLKMSLDACTKCKKFAKILKILDTKSSEKTHVAFNFESGTIYDNEEDGFQNGYTLEIENINGIDIEQILPGVKSNLPLITKDSVQVHSAYPIEAEKGSIVIHFKALDNNLKQRLIKSLHDGSFFWILEKVFHEKEAHSCMRDGTYILKFRILDWPAPKLVESTKESTKDTNMTMDPKRLVSLNRFFLLKQIDAVLLSNELGKIISNQTLFSGINMEEQRLKRADMFLTIIEQNNLETALMRILEVEGLTFVCNRLHRCAEVYNADAVRLHKNILLNFSLLANTADVEDIRDIFVERAVFAKNCFDDVIANSDVAGDVRMARLLVAILTSGTFAIATFVDALFINQLDSLAEMLLNKETEHVTLENNQVGEYTSAIVSKESKKLRGTSVLYEGIMQLVITKQGDEYQSNDATDEFDLETVQEIQKRLISLKKQRIKDHLLKIQKQLEHLIQTFWEAIREAENLSDIYTKRYMSKHNVMFPWIIGVMMLVSRTWKSSAFVTLLTFLGAYLFGFMRIKPTRYDAVKKNAIAALNSYKSAVAQITEEYKFINLLLEDHGGTFPEWITFWMAYRNKHIEANVKNEYKSPVITIKKDDYIRGLRNVNTFDSSKLEHAIRFNNTFIETVSSSMKSECPDKLEIIWMIEKTVQRLGLPELNDLKRNGKLKF